MKLEYIVNSGDEGIFVKNILKNKLKISSILVKELVTKGLVLQNSNKCFLRNKVNQGDVVSVNLDIYDNENIKYSYKMWKYKLDIIYEDEWIICVNKEAGVPCHPSVGHTEHTLYQALIYYYLNKGLKIPIHIVTRLDKDTSGIVIVAKHKYVQELLIRMMKDNLIKKEYIAVVHGKLINNNGIIDKNIIRKEGSIILRKTTDSTDDGKAAITEYKVLKYIEDRDMSLLQVILHTGRTHQIRVHMSAIGHPIVGDDLYINENKFDLQSEFLKQLLHSYKVEIPRISEYILGNWNRRNIENRGNIT